MSVCVPITGCGCAGRPAPGKELTNEFNPLEAGLWSTISTTKGEEERGGRRREEEGE